MAMQTPFPRYRSVKVSWKSVQPFPRTVVWYFCGGRKKQNKKKKTFVKHIRIRLIGGCVNNGSSSTWTTDSLSAWVAVELVGWATVDIALSSIVTSWTENSQLCCQTAYKMISHNYPAGCSTALLGRPEPPFRTGLCFTRDVFFRQPHLRGPSADRRETLPHDRNLAQKKQKITKIGGRSPKKYRGQKHAKFRSTFCTVRLWLRISPERLKISKPKREVFDIDSSCVLRNRPVNFGPLIPEI